MEMTKDIQTIISQMTNDELDVVQKEIQKIKDKRERDELKQTVSEINSLLTKLQFFRETITVNGWVDKFEEEFPVEIVLLDLVESLKKLI